MGCRSLNFGWTINALEAGDRSGRCGNEPGAAGSSSFFPPDIICSIDAKTHEYCSFCFFGDTLTFYTKKSFISLQKPTLHPPPSTIVNVKEKCRLTPDAGSTLNATVCHPFIVHSTVCPSVQCTQRTTFYHRPSLTNPSGIFDLRMLMMWHVALLCLSSFTSVCIYLKSSFVSLLCE